MVAAALWATIGDAIAWLLADWLWLDLNEFDDMISEIC
jgi:hypothetical protein